MDNKDAMSKEEEKKVTDRINELYHKKEKEGLTPEEEAEKTVKEGLTVRQLEQLVAQINGKKPKKAKKQANTYEPYIKQTENLLQEKFGTKVAVKESIVAVNSTAIV